MQEQWPNKERYLIRPSYFDMRIITERDYKILTDIISDYIKTRKHDSQRAISLIGLAYGFLRLKKKKNIK